MAKEFIVYSKTKAEFEALVSSGEVDTSQLGIIAETGEMWWNGEYRPLAECVPFANDLTGRIEATPEEFTFRPSAGDKSIRDESAVIRKIKGNTVVFAQLTDLAFNLAKENGWSVAKDVTTITWEYCSSTVNVIDTHKYLFYINTKDGRSITDAYTLLKSAHRVNFDTPRFITATETASWEWSARYLTSTNGLRFRAQAFDLTQMFGAGNEPTTIEEFKALFPNDYYDYNAGELVSMTSNGLFANGFNQFNGEYAEVLPNNTYYLGGTYTTIGFTEEIGGTLEDITIPTDKLYTSTKKGYVYATGTNININLSHTGVRNGEYEPYWDATKDLSIIQKYFPNGMRSAGSIYDEISFDEAAQKWVAIQRVGSVDLGTLKWSVYPTGTTDIYRWKSVEFVARPISRPTEVPNIICVKYKAGSREHTWAKIDCISVSMEGRLFLFDSNYTTAADKDTFVASLQGVMLYYELEEPIITTIEETVDLSYKVGDFGVEKMLSDSFSAPFKADIIYQFNATDRVRENSMNISKLSKKHNLLESEVEALESKALTTEEQNFSNDQKAQVATNLGGNTTNGLVRYVGGVLPLKKISAPDANGVEQTYVLPNASNEDKESANGVIATEGYVDEGYIPRPSGTSASKTNKLLAYSDGRTYDSGVGISQDVSDITNSATDSVPTSAQVKEYVDSQQPTEGDGISIRGKSISVKSTNAFSFKDGQLDLSADTINSIQKGVDAKTAVDELSDVVSPSISGGVRVLDITVTSGLIDDNQLVYALPSAPEESLGDADAVLATENYVRNYMSDNLPTEVATATQRITRMPSTNILPPNAIVDLSRVSLGNTITILGFDGGSGDYSYDDVWRLRFAGTSSNLSMSSSLTIYWENGIAPNYTDWAICDLEFRRLPNGEYIGKWTIYR